MDREMLITWLNDAYGMEQAQMQALERVINDYEEYSEIQDRLNQHIEETKQQAEDLETIIENLGGSVSKTKSLLGTMMGAVQQMGTRTYGDDIVRNMILLHASEHFEHASYKSLITAANELGETEVAEVCEGILEEEKDMATWTEQQIEEMAKAMKHRVNA